MCIRDSLSHVFEIRNQAPNQQAALTVAGDLLVTLHRLNRGDEMVRVADIAIAEYGAVSSIEYQAILGLFVADKKEEASERLNKALTNLNPQDPLLPRFEQMRQVFDGS